MTASEVTHAGIGQAYGPVEGDGQQACYLVLRRDGDRLLAVYVCHRKRGENVSLDNRPTFTVPRWHAVESFAAVALLGSVSRITPQWTRTRIPRVQLPPIQP